MKRCHLRMLVLLILPATCSVAAAQNVRITPLGSHAGELCARVCILDEPAPESTA